MHIGLPALNEYTSSRLTSILRVAVFPFGSRLRQAPFSSSFKKSTPATRPFHCIPGTHLRPSLAGRRFSLRPRPPSIGLPAATSQSFVLSTRTSASPDLGQHQPVAPGMLHHPPARLHEQLPQSRQQPHLASSAQPGRAGAHGPDSMLFLPVPQGFARAARDQDIIHGLVWIEAMKGLKGLSVDGQTGSAGSRSRGRFQQLAPGEAESLLEQRPTRIAVGIFRCSVHRVIGVASFVARNLDAEIV